MEIHEQEEMEMLRFDDQGSVTCSDLLVPVSETDSDQDSFVSDSESGVSGLSSDQSRLLFGGELVRLGEEDRAYQILRRRFLAGLGAVGPHATVVAVHKNSRSSCLGKARPLSFHVFSKAVEKKRGGFANVKFAWYTADSKEAIETIISHGFCDLSNNGLYGSGVYLSPDVSPLESVKPMKIGEDGMRHLLLCRVILGKTEIVRPGSDQCHPSSEEFDSGVDCVSNPNKYIVWSTHMNTHILPEYVISFRAPPSLKGFVRTPELPMRPTSPWMPLPAIMSVLTKVLPKQTTDVLANYYKDHREMKIARHEFIQRMRQLAGDRLLIAIIKTNRSKHQLVRGNGSSEPDWDVQEMECVDESG